MIPILFEKNETAFDNNGLGRLRDCISCVVTEERNGVFECDFEYPTTGAHFNEIILGRIIGVEHGYSNDIQPFDIISRSREINGRVKFHAVHVSYRLTKCVVSDSSINSLADAFNALRNAKPSNLFRYDTDKSSVGYVSAFDGIPKSVKSILGGVEGSLLDSYGGEYEFDKWNVYLHSSRGVPRDLTIRYGVNMTQYNETTDYSDTYNACVAYWKGNVNDQDVVVKTNVITSDSSGYNDRTDCVALDLTDKFESQPTIQELSDAAKAYMQSNQTHLPNQTFTIDFINLRDTLEYQHLASLFECNLCDTINVVFPQYGIEGTYKVVKTEYDVLLERYSKMELGNTPLTLSEALGITSKK